MKNIFYVDKITFLSIFHIVFRTSADKINILENQRLNRFYRLIFFFKKIKFSETKFDAGQLLTNNLECVYMSSRRLAATISLDYSETIIQSNSFFLYLNKKYGNNTIKLFISKQLQLVIESYVLKAMIVKELNNNNYGTKLNLIISKPYDFDFKILDNSFKQINFIYYSNRLKIISNILKKIGIIIIKELRFLFYRNKKSDFNHNIINSILTVEEDTISLNNNYRNQFFWFSGESDLSKTKIFTLKFSKGAIKNRSKLKKCNIEIINRVYFSYARKTLENNIHLKALKNEIKQIFKHLIFHNNLKEKTQTLIILKLFVESLNISALSIYLNSKIFLFKETHSIYSDAIQLISNKIGIRTIGMQYSNMGLISPLMLTSSDEFLIFSKEFKKLFTYKDIHPKKFIVNGYLFGGIEKYLLNSVSKLKLDLKKIGVKFTIGYFDESVQYNKWGMINVNKHKEELDKLLKYILQDSTLALVLKTQFMFNLPSKIYPNDKLIKACLSTGRYIEISNGTIRNDVYPSEVGLAADICINHKFGATAALETASLGRRTVLLNNHKSLSNWDYLFKKSNIVFDNIDDLINEIDKFRFFNSELDNFGNWDKIISSLNEYYGQNVISRIINHLKLSLKKSETIV